MRGDVPSAYMQLVAPPGLQVSISWEETSIWITHGKSWVIIYRNLIKCAGSNHILSDVQIVKKKLWSN